MGGPFGRLKLPRIVAALERFGGWELWSTTSRSGTSPEFLEGKIDVSFPGGDLGDPVVSIAPEVIDALAAPWKSSLIAKPVGCFVPFFAMEKKLKELWRPTGKMSILDLPKGYYLVRFETECDYLRALTGGPWTLFGHYLIVKTWSPEFDPESDVITTSPAWVINLPVIFYEEGVRLPKS